MCPPNHIPYAQVPSFTVRYLDGRFLLSYLAGLPCFIGGRCATCLSLQTCQCSLFFASTPELATLSPRSLLRFSGCKVTTFLPPCQAFFELFFEQFFNTLITRWLQNTIFMLYNIILQYIPTDLTYTRRELSL